MHHDNRGRGVTPELARAAKEAGLQSVSVSIDGLESTHDRLRGVKGSYQSALAALRNLTDAGIRVSVNTQINRLSMPEMEDVLERLIERGGHSWQIQLTVAMGRAADEPDVLLQPTDLLELFPLLEKLKLRCDEANVRLWPGNNIGYFGPYEHIYEVKRPRPRQRLWCRPRHARDRSERRHQGLPVTADRRMTGGNIRDNSLKDIWERSKPLRYNARSNYRRPVGLLSNLLLRGRLPIRVHVDQLRVVRQGREQPVLSPPGAGTREAGQKRSHRAA